MIRFGIDVPRSSNGENSGEVMDTLLAFQYHVVQIRIFSHSLHSQRRADTEYGFVWNVPIFRFDGDILLAFIDIQLTMS